MEKNSQNPAENMESSELEFKYLSTVLAELGDVLFSSAVEPPFGGSENPNNQNPNSISSEKKLRNKSFRLTASSELTKLLTDLRQYSNTKRKHESATYSTVKRNRLWSKLDDITDGLTRPSFRPSGK
jgi:hypothetical protein